jgi:uncharacterized cupin superfamily protein
MTQRPDVFHDAATFDDADPPGFRAGEVRPRVDGQELRARVYDVPPGETLCPYHYETVEEWLLVLAGEADVRTPSGTERLGTGALVCFAAGAEGAHRVSTPADAAGAARLMMFSSGFEPVVSVYPDSDKIGVWVPGGADNLLVHRSGGNAEYFDGES